MKLTLFTTSLEIYFENYGQPVLAPPDAELGATQFQVQPTRIVVGRALQPRIDCEVDSL